MSAKLGGAMNTVSASSGRPRSWARQGKPPVVAPERQGRPETMGGARAARAAGGGGGGWGWRGGRGRRGRRPARPGAGRGPPGGVVVRRGGRRLGSSCRSFPNPPPWRERVPRGGGLDGPERKTRVGRRYSKSRPGVAVRT